MNLVKVFTHTKDEYDLIEDFITYYGHIFGYENIIIIDNNSTNEIVLKVYEKYLKKGITIYYEDSYENNSQGENFTKYMLKYKNECEFLLGLDTDEFIFSVEDVKNNKPFDKNNIINIFKSYNKNDTLFVFESYLNSCVDNTNINYINNKFERPAKNIIYFQESCPSTYLIINNPRCLDKKFSRSEAFLKTENGNHFIHVNYGNYNTSKLGLFHFHNTGNKRQYERAKSIMEGYKYLSTNLDIETQIDTILINKKNWVCGCHRVNQYHLFLLRKFIVSLFIKYIKRLPSLQELNLHVNDKINFNTYKIIYEFAHCLETKENINKIFIIDNENEINNLLYFDEDIKKNDMVTCNYLSEALDKL